MNQITVLIVEDESIVAADLTSKLTRMGYEVVGVAAEGAEAVALAGHRRPQVVLMDICLKGSMDGVEAAHEIRTRHDLPVIYLTAHSDPATLARAKHSEPFGYILKPFQDRELATHIEVAVYKHQAERALRESEVRYRNLFNSMSEGFALHELISDSAGRPYDYWFLEANPAFERLTGLRATDIVGRTARAVLPEIEPDWIERYGRVVLTGEPDHFESWSQSLGRWYEVHASRTAPGRFAAVFLDVTERKLVREALQRAHDELELRVEQRTRDLQVAILQLKAEAGERRHLERQVLDAGDLERQRIGRDLHDSLGGGLSGLALVGKALAQTLARNRPEESALAEEIVQGINEAVGRTRSIARGLCPVGLSAFGFVSGLEELARNVEKRHRIRCQIRASEEVKIEDEPVASHLYLIVEEAVNNAVRHSQARQIEIAVDHGPARLSVTVRDDGVGLPKDVQRSPGMGLRTMRYRADVIGARLEIQSLANDGTVVTCVMPLAPEAGARSTATPRSE